MKWNIVSLLKNDNSHSYNIGTILTSDEFKEWIYVKYPEYSYITGSYANNATHKKIELCETQTEAIAFLYKHFEAWLADRVESFERMYDALNINYSPLENYDRIEEGKIIDEMHKGSKTTRTPNLTTEASTEVYGVNSSSPVDAGSSSTHETGIETSQTEDISNSKFDNNIHTFDDYRVHGNIGVTTSQQMLQSEIDLRNRVSLVNMIIDEFAYKFLTYVEVDICNEWEV